MKEILAERLLAEVLSWKPDDVAKERPVLQALATLKYDSYQQFSPGMRFVESLALWISQFETLEERRIAYRFVLDKLIFISEQEIAHFAAIAYSDYVRPHLLEKVARSQGIEAHKVSELANNPAYKRLRSSTLFFGLSDGARIDLFRRANRELSHEQIFLAYDISERKVGEVQEWLRENGAGPHAELIVLLDGFSGSGLTYLRQADGEYEGKIAKFVRDLKSIEGWKQLVRLPETELMLILYVATEGAIKDLADRAREFLAPDKASIYVEAVQRLPRSVRIHRESTDPILPLVNKYYDPSMESPHTKKGGSDLKFGFAETGLPLVLHQNTPNNSLFLLCAEDACSIRGLFPRVSRHRGDG